MWTSTKVSLKQIEFTQYPVILEIKYVRYWNEIESKKKHQKEIMIEEIKNNPNQIGMGCRLMRLLNIAHVYLTRMFFSIKKGKVITFP